MPPADVCSFTKSSVTAAAMASASWAFSAARYRATAAAVVPATRRCWHERYRPSMGWRRPAVLAAVAVLVLAACDAPGPDVTRMAAGSGSPEAAPTTAPAAPPTGPAGSSTTLPAAAGVGDALYPTLGNAGFDVDHYDLALAPDATSGVLTATATIDAVAAAPLGSFDLDLQGMTVDSAEVGGRAARWE